MMPICFVFMLHVLFLPRDRILSHSLIQRINLCAVSEKLFCVPPQLQEFLLSRSLSVDLDLPIKAFFFENDGMQIPEIKNARRVFAVSGSRFWEKLFTVQTTVEVVRLASKNKIYDITPVYLKKGDYRVKVVVGPYVWWKSFTVDDKPVILSSDFLKSSTRSLEVTPYVYDGVSRKNITDNSKIEIFYEK